MPIGFDSILKDEDMAAFGSVNWEHVLTGALALTFAGLLAGLALAGALTRFVSGLLHEVQPTDPSTYILVTILLVIVSLGASTFPARRAAGIEPTEAPRHE
jgi:ABC-type lipoprotein release transport system permease subunit